MNSKQSEPTPPPPGWNKTLDDLFDEVAAGKRDSIGSPESDWARAYQLSLLPAGIRFPRLGDVYRCNKPTDVDYLTAWRAPFTLEGQGRLQPRDRLLVHSEPAERPLSVYLEALDYDELEQRMVPKAEWRSRKYAGFYFSLSTRVLNDDFELIETGHPIAQRQLPTRPTEDRAMWMQNKAMIAWVLSFSLALLWSAINPTDRLTWVLEVAPAVIGALVLAFTYRVFRLTPLLYGLILVHCIILMVGGHYTYAEVPLFNELRDLLGSGRNNYDKIGHFAQGFVPVMIARELVVRKQVINGCGWMNFFVVCFALAFSAFYELIEWWTAILGGGSAEAFLGTQGYVWDTQSDMLYALVGAIAALTLLSRLHDRQLRRLPKPDRDDG